MLKRSWMFCLEIFVLGNKEFRKINNISIVFYVRNGFFIFLEIFWKIFEISKSKIFFEGKINIFNLYPSILFSERFSFLKPSKSSSRPSHKTK